MEETKEICVRKILRTRYSLQRYLSLQRSSKGGREDIKDTKDTKDIKDVKDAKDIKDIKDVKEIKDIKGFKKGGM